MAWTRSRRLRGARRHRRPARHQPRGQGGPRL